MTQFGVRLWRRATMLAAALAVLSPGALAQSGTPTAITATKSLDDDKLADYIRATTFKTVVGDVKFGRPGEWAQARVLQVQFQHIKGNDIGRSRTSRPRSW